jgi:hypothetical protein
MRPPQPEVAPSGLLACQTDCWSLCENSFGGSGTERAVYCALVVGTISGPTLSSTPRRPASNTVFNGASSGASANWRPPGKAIVGASTVPASDACGVASVLRSAAYWL